MPEKRRGALTLLAGQTAIYGLPTMIGRLLNYLLVPLHTRIFALGQYGTVSLLYAYSSFLMIVFSYGMETAFFRFFNREEDRETVYSTSLISLAGSSLALTGLFVIFCRTIARFVHIPDHPEYIVWLALILAIDAVCTVPFALLRQEKKAARFAWIKMVNILITIGFNLVFLLILPLYFRRSPSGAAADILRRIYNPHIGIGYVFLANLAASAFTLLLLAPELRRCSRKFASGLWKRMLRYALPMMAVGFAGMVNETMDRILLEKWLPLPLDRRLDQIGIYSACYKLSLIMTLFIQAFRMAAEPFFFEEAKNQDARKTYARTLTFFGIASSLIFLGVMLYIDIFKYFIGSKYHSGLGIVPVLLMANFCLGVYYNLSVWYKLTDRTNIGALISAGGALVTLGLNYWLIPLFGFQGSAWSTFACYFLMMVAGYLLGQHFYPIPYDLPRLIFYPFLALVFYGIHFWANQWLFPSGGPGKWLSATLFIILYMAVAYRRERPRPSASAA